MGSTRSIVSCMRVHTPRQSCTENHADGSTHEVVERHAEEGLRGRQERGARECGDGNSEHGESARNT